MCDREPGAKSYEYEARKAIEDFDDAWFRQELRQGNGRGDQQSEPCQGEQDVYAGEHQREGRDIHAMGYELRKERDVKDAHLGIENISEEPAFKGFSNASA